MGTSPKFLILIFFFFRVTYPQSFNSFIFFFMKCILWCLKLYPDFIIHKLWQLDIKTSMQFNLDDISTMNETCKYTYIIFIYHTLFTHICLTNEFWIFLQHLTLFVICFGIDLFSLLCFCLLIFFFVFFRKKRKHWKMR